MPDRLPRRGLRYLGYLLLGLFGLGVTAWAGKMALTFLNLRAMRANVAQSADRPPLPTPNAYDDYAAAVQSLHNRKEIDRLVGKKSISSPAARLKEREEFLRKNALALSRLRQGFGHEFRSPPPPPDMDEEDRVDKFNSDFGTLGRLLSIEGQVREARGDRAGAVRSYLDLIRLGADLPRGGGMIQGMVGSALQSYGRRELWDIIGRTDAATARSAVRRLESLSARHVPFRDFLTEEREQKRDSVRYMLEHPNDAPAGYGEDPTLSPEEKQGIGQVSSYMQYQALLADDAYLKTYRSHGDRPAFSDNLRDYGLFSGLAPGLLLVIAPVYDKYWVKERDGLAQLGLLSATFALRAYRAEHRAFPDRLERLVPAYLKAVPSDPFRPDRNLFYRRQGKTYLLYSVGPDSQDDGGRPINSSTETRKNLPYVEVDSKGDVVAGINP